MTHHLFRLNIFFLFSLFLSFPLAASSPRTQALGKHVEDQDGEAFTNEVKAFDAVSRLDAWQTMMLLKIKKTLPDENELC
jgi:hypothetical protein